MKFFLVSACILLLGSGLNAQQYNDCLEKDSISCLQLSIFRQAKSFFDNPSIEVFGGVSLLKSNEGRQGKAMQDNSIAVETAPTVEARSNEMGTYFMESAKKFFTERSLNFNLADTARSVARAIPDDIKADVEEARTIIKKKKSLKKLLPIIKIVGIKVALLAAGVLFHIFVTAKKALFIASVSFLLSLLGSAGAVSGLLGRFGGLFGGKSAGGAGGAAGSGSGHTTTYIVSSEPASYGSASAGSAGWSSGSSNTGGWSSSGSGWDTNGAYSAPVAQYAAYRGQPQAQQQAATQQ